MPFSLKDVDYALAALKYITTEDELDSLRKGNYETGEGTWKDSGGSGMQGPSRL